MSKPATAARVPSLTRASSATSGWWAGLKALSPAASTATKSVPAACRRAAPSPRRRLGVGVRAGPAAVGVDEAGQVELLPGDGDRVDQDDFPRLPQGPGANRGGVVDERTRPAPAPGGCQGGPAQGDNRLRRPSGPGLRRSRVAPSRATLHAGPWAATTAEALRL